MDKQWAATTNSKQRSLHSSANLPFRAEPPCPLVDMKVQLQRRCSLASTLFHFELEHKGLADVISAESKARVQTMISVDASVHPDAKLRTNYGTFQCTAMQTCRRTALQERLLVRSAAKANGLTPVFPQGEETATCLHPFCCPLSCSLLVMWASQINLAGLATNHTHVWKIKPCMSQ